MKYSPYTPEWNRKRYLSAKDIVGDILDVLSEEVSYYKGRANSLQEVLDGIQES